MTVNITNPQAIEEWLQGMSAGDDDIACWLQKAFSKALKKREQSAVPLREWPQNPPAWMKPDGSYHEFRPDPELTQKVSHITDWLAAARRQDPAFVENLYPMDLASAFNRAEKYFTKVNQRNQAIVADDDDTTTIMRFDNGARIVQLLTPEALKYEGTKMGHCIGGRGYDDSLLSGREVFYSLRDAKNEPHATMEAKVDGNILRQCKGKKNAPPIEKYMPMLQQFLTQQQFALTESAAYCGLVQDTDGQYYSINKLPKNLSIKGYLNLSYCTSLTQLPENLSVGGSFSLEGTILTKLLVNLSVGGNFLLCHSAALTQLPENLSVGGDLYINGCSNITSIPRNLKCRGKILTNIGNFTTVAEAADAFDKEYRPGQPRSHSPSTG